MPKKKTIEDFKGVFQSKSYGTFTVIRYEHAHDVTIKFCSTGHELKTNLSTVYRGAVADPLYPSIFGKGYTGIGNYSRSKEHRSCYHCWWDMLSRCYNESNKRYLRYGGKGVVVEESWLNYQTFAEWYYNNYKEGYHIDKDILGDGSTYSKDFCIFVPKSLNNLLVTNNLNRGEYPVGVCWDESKGKFLSSVRNPFNDNTEFLGRYSCPDEAFEVYKKRKIQIIKEVAEYYLTEEVIDEKTYKALVNKSIVKYPT